MRKHVHAFMLCLILAANHTMAASPARKDKFEHCAVLTWPDGQKTKLRGFNVLTEYVELCTLRGGCKIDGQEYPSDRLMRAVTDATLDCIYPPVSTSDQDDCNDAHNAFIEARKSLAPSLDNACQRIFMDPAAPIFPEIAAECSSNGEPDENWCQARRLAGHFLKREQGAEYSMIHNTLLNDCPSPQLREYLKLRLYYLATQLEPGEIPGDASMRDFDFGPVDRTLLNSVRAHVLSNLQGKEYETAVETHRPNKPLLLGRTEAVCNRAAKGALP